MERKIDERLHWDRKGEEERNKERRGKDMGKKRNWRDRVKKEEWDKNDGRRV